jgi:hypothetical protein
MFKLTNILGSGSNLAEPVYLPIDKSCRYTVGGVAVMKDGRLIPARSKDRPTHLLGESRGLRESGNILAYRITEGMIFEVPIVRAPKAERIGTRVAIDDTRGTSDAVVPGDGAAVIIDMNGAQEAGDTLFVLFPERKES